MLEVALWAIGLIIAFLVWLVKKVYDHESKILVLDSQMNSISKDISEIKDSIGDIRRFLLDHKG